MIYVLAIRDGDSYPSVLRIFLTEEAAIEYVRIHNGDDEDEDQKTTLQFDIDKDQGNIIDEDYWMGKCEEGQPIKYYRSFINKLWLSHCRLSATELSSVRAL